MPMGIVSDNDFDSELSKVSTDKTIETVIVKEINKGRGKGNLEVPNSLRELIGEESVTNGRASALELANDFGIKPSSVSAYDVGATSTKSYNERPNLNKLNEARERISKRARAKLIQSLNKITPDKLDMAKPGELAVVARSMAAIIKDMEPPPQVNNTNNNGPTFVLYAPQFRKEEIFDVIQAKE